MQNNLFHKSLIEKNTASDKDAVFFIAKKGHYN